MDQKGQSKEQKYDPSGKCTKLHKLLPKKRGKTDEERAREIEGVMDWMRETDASPDGDDVIEKFSQNRSIPVSSVQERLKVPLIGSGQRRRTLLISKLILL